MSGKVRALKESDATEKNKNFYFNKRNLRNEMSNILKEIKKLNSKMLISKYEFEKEEISKKIDILEIKLDKVSRLLLKQKDPNLTVALINKKKKDIKEFEFLIRKNKLPKSEIINLLNKKIDLGIFLARNPNLFVDNYQKNINFPSEPKVYDSYYANTNNENFYANDYQNNDYYPVYQNYNNYPNANNQINQSQYYPAYDNCDYQSQYQPIYNEKPLNQNNKSYQESQTPITKEIIKKIPVEIIKEVPVEIIKKVPVDVVKELPKQTFENAKNSAIEVIKEIPTEIIKETSKFTDESKDNPTEFIQKIPVEVIKEIKVVEPVKTLEENANNNFHEIYQENQNYNQLNYQQEIYNQDLNNYYSENENSINKQQDEKQTVLVPLHNYNDNFESIAKFQPYINVTEYDSLLDEQSQISENYDEKLNEEFNNRINEISELFDSQDNLNDITNEKNNIEDNIQNNFDYNEQIENDYQQLQFYDDSPSENYYIGNNLEQYQNYELHPESDYQYNNEEYYPESQNNYDYQNNKEFAQQPIYQDTDLDNMNYQNQYPNDMIYENQYSNIDSNYYSDSNMHIEQYPVYQNIQDIQMPTYQFDNNKQQIYQQTQPINQAENNVENDDWFADDDEFDDLFE